MRLGALRARCYLEEAIAMASNFINNLRMLLTTGGIAEAEFELIKPDIKRANLRTFTSLTGLFLVVMCCLTITSFFIPAIATNQALYIVTAVGAALMFAWCMAARKRDLPSAAVPYIVLVLGFAYGIYIGAINGGDYLPAVTFMVLLLGLPLLIVDRPYRVAIIIVVAATAMIIIALAIKKPEAASLDVVDAISFGLVSIYANVLLTRSQITEITHRHHAEAALDFDALTGLRNSHAYHALIHEVESDVDAGNLAGYGVIVADVNDLKVMNDVYGHAAGDDLLRTCARFLCEVFSDSPVMRIGGDEFVVILKGRDYEDRDELVAGFDERMRAVRFRTEGEEHGISIAIGLAVYDASAGMRYTDVFNAADTAMYRKKVAMKAETGGIVR